jgi:hypothetical protein
MRCNFIHEFDQEQVQETLFDGKRLFLCRLAPASVDVYTWSLLEVFLLVSFNTTTVVMPLNTSGNVRLRLTGLFSHLSALRHARRDITPL